MADPLTSTKDAYAAFQRSDIAAVMENFADDVEWTLPDTPGAPLGGTYRGKAAVQQWFGTLAQTLDFHVFETQDFIAQGDKVVVLVHTESTVRSTGKKLVDDLAHVHTFRDGKLVRFREYSDTAKFMAALQK